MDTTTPSIRPTPVRTAQLRSTPPAVAFEGVGHDYGRTVALDGFDLRVQPGEVVAVLGPNGAGKTTAMHALMGLLTPTRGRVRLRGRDPRDRAAREGLGAMLQISGVPETLTVREHLQCFAAYYPAALPLADVLARVGLTEVADRPYGKLSGGQKQRLHLAIALVGDPEVLVLDEPTTGLDAASRRALWSVVRDLIERGRAIVLSTHDLAEADALADRIVLLHHGRVLAEGTPAQIKSATASRRVRVVSRLGEDWFRARPGVAGVRRDGQAIEVLCAAAEPLVLDLLRADPEARDLEVSGASLEDAFLALTQHAGPAASAHAATAVAA